MITETSVNLFRIHFTCFLTFMFTLHRTMGYQQEVVERVVKATGQTEDTFLVLEKIVEETKRCENGGKVRQLNSVHPTDASSSSSSSTVSRFREKELGRTLEDPGRSKENIKPSLHGSNSNGLGHRRQCSGSETSTQQVFLHCFCCSTGSAGFSVNCKFS